MKTYLKELVEKILHYITNLPLFLSTDDRHNTSIIAYKEFEPHAENFEGLFEPIVKIVNNTFSKERIVNTLEEWDIRISNLPGNNTEIKKWWENEIYNGTPFNSVSRKSLIKKTKKIQHFLLGNGVIRDNRTNFTATSDMNIYYQTNDLEDLEIGEEYTIETPCWYIPYSPDRVIEQGYCYKKK